MTLKVKRQVQKGEITTHPTLTTHPLHTNSFEFVLPTVPVPQQQADVVND